MNAASIVFNTPELLEFILLSLPCDTTYQETSSMRDILLAQSTSRTWYNLLRTSTPIRQRVYRPSPADHQASRDWYTQHCFPSARPNPWIPELLLNQRSWGSLYPFDNAFTVFMSMEPSQPRFWTFSLEMSRAQYSRLPPPGPWREMLASSPPFMDCWYTRCFYELGSGRAPFVTHVDYDATLSKSEQRYRIHCASGITLGHICDAMRELFEPNPTAKFVMVESVRMPQLNEESIELSEDRPTTKMHVPGLSAEGVHSWHGGS